MDYFLLYTFHLSSDREYVRLLAHQKLMRMMPKLKYSTQQSPTYHRITQDWKPVRISI